MTTEGNFQVKDGDFSEDEPGTMEINVQQEKDSRVQHDPIYEVGQRVLCKEGDSNGLYYEAKIIFVTQYDDQPMYKVHFIGWPSNQDEDVLQMDTFDRFQECTEENKQRAKDIYEQHLQKGRKSSTKSKRGNSIGTVGSAKSNQRMSTRSSKRSAASYIQVDTATPVRKRSRMEVKSKKKQMVRMSPEQSDAGSENEDIAQEPGIFADLEKEADKEKSFLPPALLAIFKMDKFYVDTEYKLPIIPARISIAKIIGMYIEKLDASKGKGIEGAEEEPKKTEQTLSPKGIEGAEEEPKKTEQTLSPKGVEGAEEEPKKTEQTLSPKEIEKSLIMPAKQFAVDLLKQFNVPLVMSLLYKSEGPLFDDLLKDETEDNDEGEQTKSKTEMSTRLGINYLLRHLNKLLVSETSMETDDSVATGAQDLLRFLDERSEEFFMGGDDYQEPETDYMKRVHPF